MQPAEQPLHTDRHRNSLIQLLNPAIVVFLLAYGAIQGEAFVLFLGAIFGLYVAFTRHRQYEVFRDRLVIRYWAPRSREVPLTDIEDVQTARPPLLGPSVVVRRRNNMALILTPGDPEEFTQQLKTAVEGA